MRAVSTGSRRFLPGTYQVKVELGGFQTLVRERIDVLVGQTTPLDFSMKVAAVCRKP